MRMLIERYWCGACNWFYARGQLRSGRVCPICGEYTERRRFTEEGWDAFVREQT